MIRTFSINRFMLIALTVVLSNNMAVAASSSSSNQVIKLKATIVGSKEQPRFLSIVPWKNLASPVINARTVNSVVFERLNTVTPKQITMKQDLTQYLKDRYVKNNIK